MNKQGPILGTTLYSFTNEWKMRLYSLEQVIAKVAELELGPAVEVVGFQSFREYPDISDEFAENFRASLEQHALIPSCLGGNIDVGRHPERSMTEEETIAYIERQIMSAKKLGFPVLRVQAFVGPKIFERIAPIAERAGVHVACELHSPLTADHPEVVGLRECYDRLGTPFLGFVPDFSSVMTSPPEIHWANLRSLGASEALIETVKEIWESDRTSSEKFSALAEAEASFGVDKQLTGQLRRTITMFGNMPVDGLRELIPYTRHIHGKFYHVTPEGNEPSIPYPDLMNLLKEEGYAGTISAEWEGHAFTEEMIGFQEVQAWQSMCRRLFSDE
jgi:sugar phosphate isomerase/epimerase